MDKIIHASESQQKSETRWLNQLTIIPASPIHSNNQIQAKFISQGRSRDNQLISQSPSKTAETSPQNGRNVFENSDRDSHTIFNPQPPKNYMWPFLNNDSLLTLHVFSPNEHHCSQMEQSFSRLEDESPLSDNAPLLLETNSVALNLYLERIQKLKAPDTLRILKPLFDYLWKLLSGQTISKASCYLCPSEQRILQSFVSRKYPSLTNIWPSS